MSTCTAESVVLGVPDLARLLDVKLDRLRLLLRRHESLRSLLTPVGGIRVLPRDSLESFREALAQVSR